MLTSDWEHVNMQIPIQRVWDGPQDSAFLTSSREITRPNHQGLDYRVVLFNSNCGSSRPTGTRTFCSVPVHGYQQKAGNPSKISPFPCREHSFPGPLGQGLSKSEKGTCALASSLLLDVATPGLMHVLNCPVVFVSCSLMPWSMSSEHFPLQIAFCLRRLSQTAHSPAAFILKTIDLRAGREPGDL